MKSTKSYTVRIGGNKDKVLYLYQQLELVKQLSEFAFSQGKDNWRITKPLYHACRKEIPELNSTVVQNFLNQKFVSCNWKLKPQKSPKASIIINYQSCGLMKDDSTKLTSYWIRFHRKNFPLFGKTLLRKVSDLKELKQIEIFERKGKLYCRLSITKQRVTLATPNKHLSSVGLDVNAHRLVLSNNDFYHLQRYYYRKTELKKRCPKGKTKEQLTKKDLKNRHHLLNYTKDTLHKVTTKIANDLLQQGIKVLFLEDLINLRDSSSKKKGTSKGKLVNGIVNSMPFRMIQTFLEYKCLDRGIQVRYVNPAYTSRTCSKCHSQDFTRRKTAFSCKACGLHLDADLNGSRNIQRVYYAPGVVASESDRLPPVK